MPKSLATFLIGPCCLGASILIGCFGSEPDDSPFTIPRGEAFESIQLEIEPDGTPILLARVAMYMAHNDPDADIPEENRVSAQNYRSLLLRRSAGVWNATAFKNLQSHTTALPTLIPDSEGSFQAFLSDGGEIKRYVFGNGSWNRAAGTDWPMWMEYGGRSFGSNWNRHPRIGVAGKDLLLTLHSGWEKGGIHWVMEGRDRRVALVDSGGEVNPIAFHTGPGYRALAATGFSKPMGSIEEGFSFKTELHYYRWGERAGRAEKQVLGRAEYVGESFFAAYKGRSAFFASVRDQLLVFPLDDSGRVAGRDSLPLPEIGQMINPMLAVDTAGCLHTLATLSDSGDAVLRYGHWNGCAPDAVDTLAVPKPDPSKPYWGNGVNLRIAPDGTPVAALLLREIQKGEGFHIEQSWSDPTFLFVAELRAGGWRLEKVDERRPRVPAP